MILRHPIIKIARWQQICGMTFETANVAYTTATKTLKTMIFKVETAKGVQAN